MEIKAQLLKPYTEKQKIDFIVEQNHRNSYEIKETETALEAWGYTEEEIKQELIEKRNLEIKQKISDLEKMALSEVLEGNKDNVNTYNQVIISLRENLVFC